ncbi:MAG: hypothetical protein IJ804_06875 [Prevotella sp.]|nr:hypothetical protein [Prevotella sp.]
MSSFLPKIPPINLEPVIVPLFVQFVMLTDGLVSQVAPRIPPILSPPETSPELEQLVMLMVLLIAATTPPISSPDPSILPLLEQLLIVLLVVLFQALDKIPAAIPPLMCPSLIQLIIVKGSSIVAIIPLACLYEASIVALLIQFLIVHSEARPTKPATFSLPLIVQVAPIVKFSITALPLILPKSP